MLADKVYCLHPGRLQVVVMGRNEKGEPTDKPLKAWKYFGPEDLAKAYGVDLKLCVIWGRSTVGQDHLIHLKPDREGKYELPKLQGALGPKPDAQESSKSVPDLVPSKKKTSPRK